MTNSLTHVIYAIPFFPITIYRPVIPEITLEQRQREAELKLRQLNTQLEREHRREEIDASKDAQLSNTLTQLDSIQPLLDDLDTILVRHSDAKNRVSEIRYQQWQRQVYNVIDKQIQRKLSKMTSEEIANRRRELFNEYLRITNYKRVVCDVVDPDEYNPLRYKSKGISVSTKNIQNPLRRELDNMEADDRAMSSLRLQQAGATTINTSRGIVPTTEWNKVGDRHNRYCGEPGPVRQHPMSRSNIVFDHFNIEK